ncbi:MAG: hypothetical protein SFZ03_02705 [Candidatus Melainabacteria bacterium]|nr:hypothetical protein [Candidatus Melainabacteria bacterium]
MTDRYFLNFATSGQTPPQPLPRLAQANPEGRQWMDGIRGETEKAPSDSEEGGVGGTSWDSPLSPDTVIQTMKYPSDSEEGGSSEAPWATQPGDLGGGYQTMKAPSDSEEGGVGELPGDGGIFPLPDSGVETMKYPSDSEEGGVGELPGDGGIFPLPDSGIETLKYPSDSEDGGASEAPGDGGIFPLPDSGIETMKYPSDSEDGGSMEPGGIEGPMPWEPSNPSIVEQTLAFPSDAETGGVGEAPGDDIIIVPGNGRWMEELPIEPEPSPGYIPPGLEVDETLIPMGRQDFIDCFPGLIEEDAPHMPPADVQEWGPELMEEDFGHSIQPGSSQEWLPVEALEEDAQPPAILMDVPPEGSSLQAWQRPRLNRDIQ